MQHVSVITGSCIPNTNTHSLTHPNTMRYTVTHLALGKWIGMVWTFVHLYIYTYKCKHSDVHVAHTSSLSSALVEKLGRFTADSQHITAEAHLTMCTDTPTPTHTHSLHWHMHPENKITNKIIKFYNSINRF